MKKWVAGLGAREEKKRHLYVGIFGVQVETWHKRNSHKSIRMATVKNSNNNE